MTPKADKKKGLTLAAFAAKCGRGVSTIKSWKVRGWLVHEPNGRIDEARSLARLRELGKIAPEANPLDEILGTSPKREEPSPTQDPEGSARARKLLADAEIAEIKLGEMQERLVDVELVGRAWIELVRSIRNALRAIPSRLAGELAAVADEHEVRLRLATEIDEALTRLAEDEPPVAPSSRKANSGRKRRA